MNFHVNIVFKNYITIGGVDYYKLNCVMRDYVDNKSVEYIKFIFEDGTYISPLWNIKLIEILD